jgi:glucan biosynthesis protein C
VSKSITETRFNNLDFLRAFALLAGVLLHALSLYLEPIDGSEPRPLASILFIWIHSWRVPLFMVLAGFFTCLSLSKRSTSSYALNRLVRLGGPLILLWVAIPAVDESAAQMFKSPDFISWIMTGGQFNLRLDHLWFLYYLLIFYALVLALKALTPPIFELMVNFKLNFLTISFFWLPIVTLFAPWAKPVGGVFSEVPTTFGELKVGSMLFMLSFFIIGMQLFNHQTILQRLQAKRFWITAIICCSFVPIGSMAWGIMKDSPFVFSSTPEMWVVNAISTCASLFMVLAFIGASSRYILASSPILSWLVKLSYPTYVFHLVFVYSIGAILLLSGLNATLVVIGSFFSGVIGSIVIYYLLVWYTPLDWVFNGYKNSKFKLKIIGGIKNP